MSGIEPARGGAISGSKGPIVNRDNNASKKKNFHGEDV
jgi:hypothetical protein